MDNNEVLGSINILSIIMIVLLIIATAFEMDCSSWRKVSNTDPIGRHIEFNDTLFILTPLILKDNKN